MPNFIGVQSLGVLGAHHEQLFTLLAQRADAEGQGEDFDHQVLDGLVDVPRNQGIPQHIVAKLPTQTWILEPSEENECACCL